MCQAVQYFMQFRVSGRSVIQVVSVSSSNGILGFHVWLESQIAWVMLSYLRQNSDEVNVILSRGISSPADVRVL